MNTGEAINELGKMARFARAFEHAEEVLETLRKAERAQTEVEAATVAKREELAEATRDVAAARDTAQTLEAHAKALVEQAKQDAAALRQKAQADAADAREAVSAAAAKAAEELDALQFKIAAAKTEIAERTAELDAVGARLAAARDAAKKLLEG